VPFVSGGWIPFALEHVAQVPSAVRAHDLCPRHAEAVVLVAGDSSRDAVEIRRPAAAGLELVVRLVQRGTAAGARVDAGVGEELVVLARARRLGSLLPQDPELLCKKRKISCVGGYAFETPRLGVGSDIGGPHVPLFSTARHSSLDR
jgi:hypothetical protein